MDHVVDSQSCTKCGHDHYPYDGFVAYYAERKDECGEPGCDCNRYKAPETPFTSVYKCSSCGRMMTRVYRTFVGDQQCDGCYHDD